MTSEEIGKSVLPLGSWMFQGDIDIYYKYARLLPDGAIVVDVATGRGVSALAMAMANPKIQVVTVENGQTMLFNKWATDKEDYIKKIYDLCKERDVSNIKLVYQDFFTFDYKLHFGSISVDMFHVDDENKEGDMLRIGYDNLKAGGYALVRNYTRFKKEADEICKGGEYLECGGLMQVVKKV